MTERGFAERKVPRYRTISVVIHYAWQNDYPKNKDKFVWGIPSKYNKAVNREISALTTCFIYDGTKRSLKAASRVDSLFGGSPYEFLSQRKHHQMIMECNQGEIIYNKLRMRDLYYFFCSLESFYGQYGSVLNAYNNSKGNTPIERLINAITTLNAFKDDTLLTYSRLNLFLFMVVHCFDDYNIKSSDLLAPLFEQFIPVCKTIGLLSNESKYNKDVFTELTDNLKWFSEQHPLTFWVGVIGYKEAIAMRDNMISKLANAKLVRHRFKKR